MSMSLLTRLAYSLPSILFLGVTISVALEFTVDRCLLTARLIPKSSQRSEDSENTLVH